MRLFHHSILFVFLATALFSCKKRGCTDTEALNYDQTAKKDDHGCYFYWIGQKYGGGRVFYIDQTKKHGLISAEFYLGELGYPWGTGGQNISGADGTFVGTGNQNTIDIVNAFGEGTAAYACYSLDTLGFDDWYLPSKEELKGLADNLGKIGQANFTGSYHSSSSEIDENTIWTVFGANQAFAPVSKGSIGCVRPIRSF